MDKVKLPPKVVDAIESIRKSGMTDFYIIGEAYKGSSNRMELLTIIQYIRDNTGDWDNESDKGYTHVMNYLTSTQEGAA